MRHGNGVIGVTAHPGPGQAIVEGAKSDSSARGIGRVEETHGQGNHASAHSSESSTYGAASSLPPNAAQQRLLGTPLGVDEPKHGDGGSIIHHSFVNEDEAMDLD